MSVAASNADIRRSDLAVATTFTMGLFAATLFALTHARLSHHAELPVIDPGQAIPIAVRPVADLAAGGSSSGASVPEAWRRKPPRARKPAAAPVEPEAPHAEQQPTKQQPTKQQPTKPHPTAPASEEPPASEPPPEPLETPTELPDIEPDGDPEGAGQGAGAGEGARALEGEGAGGGVGDGQGEGAGEGAGEGGDPLLARAIAFYRARLVAWFSARFRVSNSGLSSDELTKYRVRVNIEIGDDLRIVNYRVLSSDHPAFEAAARSTLDKLRGESLPPPPENYPGAVQHHLTVTFTCAEDSCD